jgi:hypothetical protein
MQKIKDREKESKSIFFPFVLGCLLVSAFVLCHWRDTSYAHALLIGSANSTKAVISIVQPS